ncbi:MAG: HAMP domain-containing sensor histidine kinase [Labilithrix sp.]
MTSPKARSWWTWSRGGSVAMAALSVISLGATVIAAQRALGEASVMVVRGEGDVILGAVASDLATEEQPPTSAVMERVLKAHETDGLRYVAIVDREGRPIAEAGDATMAGKPLRPGAPAIEGRRARVLGMVGPPRRFPHGRPPPPPPPLPPMGGPMMLVAELEPPMVATLEHGLVRIAVVAGIASVVLLAFALAWSRNARRLNELEAKAARDERLVALGGMSSVMAHELRNPLASLKGHAQLLVEDLEGKPRAKAERVVKEAVRLEVLTTSLLDFVRDGPIERKETPPRRLVDLALRDLEELAKGRVEISIADDASLSVDADRLSRALHNLIDNALKAGEGKVEVRVERDQISVRDHGPGIAAADRQRIFEPFVTTRTRGTGLGLAVARRIAEQHGGSLDGDNHPDGGAIFTLKTGAS